MDSEILHMILTILMVTASVLSAHIVTVDASLNALRGFNSHVQRWHYFMESVGGARKTQIEKVSGGDENEEKEAQILAKFRSLLGFKRTVPRVVPLAPSPCPSPSPAPMLSVHHLHSHPRLHHLKAISPPPKNVFKNGKHESIARRTLIAILVSAGVVFIAFVLGLFWVCLKLIRYGRRSGRTMPLHSKNRGNRGKFNWVTSRCSASKVSLSPSHGSFDVNCLETNVETQAVNYAQSPETLTSNSKENLTFFPLHNMEKLETEPASLECHSLMSCSSPKEITMVHEETRLVEYESKDAELKCEPEDEDSATYESDYGCNSICEDEVISIGDANSSDDESFHSFCDSHSSSSKLSNVSGNSCNEKLGSVLLTSLKTAQDLKATNTSYLLQKSSAHVPFHGIPSDSTEAVSKASSSSTMPASLSPTISSSSGSNGTPRSLLSSLQETPKPPPCVLGGVPPPPPPPPLLKGSGGSLKIPPPPPSQLPQYMPLGKGGSPLPKLKPLHWDKVRATPDRTMVWDKLRTSSFEFDEEMIESLFGYNLQKSMTNDEEKSKTPSPSKHVLEPKRLQNITILSKALNVTDDQVCIALLRGEGLSLQQLEALSKMVPTKEEEGKLHAYRGDISDLGSAERLVKAMLYIPFAFQRIEAMLYKATFEDEVVHLRKSFSILEEACVELRSSRLFLKLLEAVLKTGNRMNVGTIRGGARAFKLDALLKLADVKGTDGKTNLLHFVVQEIIRSEGVRVSDSIMGMLSQKNQNPSAQEREEDYRRMGLDLVSSLSTELCNVKKTASIDLDVLANSVSNLTDGMSKLQHLLHQDLTDAKSQNFVRSLRVFLTYAENNLKGLQDDENKVLLLVREITEYFHGDVSKEEANPLRIFVIVRDFLGMLDHVCKEIRSSKLQSSSNPLAPFR